VERVLGLIDLKYFCYGTYQNIQLFSLSSMGKIPSSYLNSLFNNFLLETILWAYKFF